MTWTETAAAVLTALACGFLLGAEREQGGGVRAAGARTFPLFALAGALGTLLGWVGLLVLGLGVVTLVGISYLQDIRADYREGIGMSSEVAALIAFALGALCTDTSVSLTFEGRLLLAGSITACTLSLLTFKQMVHGAIGHLSREDIYAGTKLLLLLVVMLPLLPNEPMGPYGALNPRKLGILVSLISALGLAGYLSMRVLGPNRGLGLTGLLGGLVSSTAVTLSFAGRARKDADLTPASALAIVLACATMFPRVLVELLAVSPDLAQHAMASALTAGGVGFAGAVIIFLRVPKSQRGGARQDNFEVTNPFSIVTAIKFTVVFALVLLVSHAAQSHFGSSGTYLAALVSGLTDVDAITLTLARMHASELIDTRTAVIATGLSAATNTLVKIGLATVLGGLKLGMQVGASLLAALLAGGLCFVLIP